MPAAYKGDGGKVRLLANPAGTNSFIPFVMQKYKLDAKYGFELQVVPAVNQQAMLTAVQAGGAEIGQVIIATVGGLALSFGVLALVIGHRSGRLKIVGRAAAVSNASR